MSEFAERAALVCREAMGLGDGEVPTLETIEAWLHTIPGLTVEVDPEYPVPHYTALGEGVGVITLPLRYRVEDLAHEASHHLGGHGLAAYLRAVARGNPDLLRLADRCGWQEESAAQKFVVCLFLPERTVLTHTDYQLAELVPWSLETIRKRRWEILWRVWCSGFDLGVA